MNILFTINRGYMEHMMDCIRSILRFPADEGYDIYIMHSEVRAEDEIQMKERIGGAARLHFICVDADEDFGGRLSAEERREIPLTDRYPIEIYYRIFAAYLLPKNLDRILYLDGDTLVIHPLQELYEQEFEGNSILACTHIRKFLNKINQIRLGIREECPYINSGVMLMNLEALREKQNFQEVMDYVKKHKNFLTLPDQDILTALYGSKVGLLDTMRYNLSDRMIAFYNADFNHREKVDLDWVRENAVVIHYCGRQKPWKEGYHGILDVFYKELKEEKNRN